MKKNSFTAFIIFFILNIPLLNSQDLSIDFVEKFTIGERESEKSEYLFGNIRIVHTDKNSMIYVADGSDNSIRVFNQEGDFIT
jgi:hypothetical protein